MVKGLVDLITPAYNSADFIFRLLDSVLIQTYPMIKMYVVDDGSTDNTREVIEGYIPLFAKKGYELEYLYQKNAGQSNAINNALKLVDGEFLLWPDSDDWYKEPDAIEKLVGVLQDSGDEVGVARCRYEFISDNTFQVTGNNAYPNYGIPEYIMDDAISSQNGFIWALGGWIVKTVFIDKYIPNRNIYTEKDAGQNAQLLLPFFANCKCVSIDEVLFCYLLREASHSRRKSYDDENRRVEAWIRTYTNTLDAISVVDKSKLDEYKRHIRCRFYPRLLENDIEYKETRNFRRHIKECKNLNVPLIKRYKKMAWWTKLFSVKSYFMISEYHAVLRGFIYRKHNQMQSNE